MKILGTDGKPIEKTRVAKAALFVSDDCETWTPVKPYNVPECLKDRRTMGYLMAGEIVETTDGKLYRAEVLH